MAERPMPYLGERFQMPSMGLFGKSGIYFLWLKDEVVYVGQGKIMRQRIGAHISEGVKHFDSVSGIPVQPSQLNQQERFFIQLLAPRYNQCYFGKIARKQRDRCERWGVHMMPLEGGLPQGMAAHYLGVSNQCFAEWVNAGIGPTLTTRRVGKSRVRIKHYTVADLVRFAAENQDLIEAAQKQAA